MGGHSKYRSLGAKAVMRSLSPFAVTLPLDLCEVATVVWRKDANRLTQMVLFILSRIIFEQSTSSSKEERHEILIGRWAYDRWYRTCANRGRSTRRVIL